MYIFCIPVVSFEAMKSVYTGEDKNNSYSKQLHEHVSK